MTREEAIKELSYIADEMPSMECTDWKEAIYMAIKALEREDILDKIRADITDWQTDIHDNEYDAESHDFIFERIYEIIDEYKKYKGKTNEALCRN